MDQPDSFFFSKQSEFFTSDVERITGVKRARLQTWLERGWITPSLYKAQGSGEKNKFNALDLIKISIFKKCVENGLARSSIAEFLKDIGGSLRDFKERTFREGWENRHPIYIYILRSDGKVDYVLLRNWGGVEGIDFSVASASMADDLIGINLSKIVRDLKTKLKS